LITGGAGFIGSHLAERLLAQGHHVTAIDNLVTGQAENLRALHAHPRLSFHHASVLDEALMNALVPQHDAVFHLAAAVGVR
jgi:UDP-glucose 4-epimerase